jgi:signal transduction histidine kinase
VSFIERRKIPQYDSSIHTLSRRSVEVSDWRELLVVLTVETTKMLDADRAFLALVNEDSGELNIHAVAGEGWSDELRAQRLKIASGQDSAGKGRGITGYAAATGKTYITGNVAEDPHYYKFFNDVASEIAVPLLDDNGITRGVLNLQSKSANFFNLEHCRFLEIVANMAVMRLMVARYHVREIALVELGKDLSAITDVAALMKRVVDVAADVLRFEDCSIFILDKDRNELVLQASRGPLIGKIGTATYPLGEGLTGWVAQHGEAIRTKNPKTDPRWQGRYAELPLAEIGAFLAVPIYGRSSILGALRVLRKWSDAPWFSSEFNDDDEMVLSTIASQLGSALENNRILDRLVATERMAAWGEMSAKAAHMIGNRTFAIKGDLNELEYLLSEQDDRRTTFRRLAESIRKGIFRLEEILQEFRDFVRATHLTVNEYNLNDIIINCVEESFPKRGVVKLELDLDPSLPTIPADSSRLERAFSELIENALSFMPEEGEMTIRSSVANPHTAQRLAGLTRSRTYLCVEFSDTGPGVPFDAKERIFTPFYTSRAKGMGLGLSIVKGILEAHHGNIIETGLEGQGAKFLAFLPTTK